MDRPHRAVVDDVERVQTEVAEVVVDAGGQLWGEIAGCHDLSGGRRAPSLVTITNPPGTGAGPAG